MNSKLNCFMKELKHRIEKAPVKVYYDLRDKFFIRYPISYISYTLAKKSFIEYELLSDLFITDLHKNDVITGLLTDNYMYYEDIATGLEFLKYELENFPSSIYSIAGNDISIFIEAIDSYIEEDLFKYKKLHEEYLKQVEEQNKEFEALEEGVV